VDITEILPRALTSRWRDIDRTFVAAGKFTWAAHRQEASRGEDEAYSFLGLFDVNIPMLYGEGQRKALIRLQEHIYQRDADHSLFLFRTAQAIPPLFAPRLTGYCQGYNCLRCGGQAPDHCFDICYSELCYTSSVSARSDSGNDQFVRIVRDEVMVDLPLMAPKDVPRHHLDFGPSWKDRCMLFDLSSSDIAFAVLGVSILHQGAVIMPLSLQKGGVYHRLRRNPVFLSHQFDLSNFRREAVNFKAQSAGTYRPKTTMLKVHSPDLVATLLHIKEVDGVKEVIYHRDLTAWYPHRNNMPVVQIILQPLSPPALTIVANLRGDEDPEDGNLFVDDIMLVEASMVETQPVTIEDVSDLNETHPVLYRKGQFRGNRVKLTSPDSTSFAIALRRLDACNNDTLYDLYTPQYRINVERRKT
jgi:hypothetical protein